MRRAVGIGAAAAVAVAASLAAAPPAAGQAVTSGATAYSASAAVGGASLHANLSLTGAVGGLLDGIVSPIVNSALNPLVSALQGTLDTTVSTLLGASSSYHADTPSQQVGPGPGAFPTDPMPSSCLSTSASRPCYSAANVTADASPLASLTLPALTGYTQQVQPTDDSTNSIFGRAQVSSPAVRALGGVTGVTNPVVAATVVDSKANCPNAGTSSPTALVSASGVSLLGGLVQLSVQNGKIASLVVNGTTVGTLSQLPVTTLAGGIVVQSYGTAVRIDVPLGAAQLLAGLGLSSSAVNTLTGYLTTSSVKLTLLVGPGSAVTSATARAWGLGIGADLSGALNFDLLGLVGARVSMPSGIGGGNYGNLLDLRLAYTSCQSGSAGPTTTKTPAVPPANV